MQLATIECPLCGGKQDVDVAQAGQTMACSQCGRTIQIPAADDLRGAFPPPPPPQAPPASPPIQSPVSFGLRPPVPVNLMSVDCPCGNRFQVPPGAAGLTLPCPACGQPVTIPVAVEPALETAAAAELADSELPPSGLLLPPRVGQAAEGAFQELPLLPPAATSWVASATSAADFTGGEAHVDPLRQTAARRARRRMVRNVVLWTIGMIALLAMVVYLSR